MAATLPESGTGITTSACDRIDVGQGGPKARRGLVDAAPENARIRPREVDELEDATGALRGLPVQEEGGLPAGPDAVDLPRV